MAVAVKALPAPRYGSVAEMSSYAGLSPKTIRRLVDSGRVRGFKVGRRLVIPFEEIDRAIVRTDKHRRQPIMATAPATNVPQATVDPSTGRLLPLSDDERRARSKALNRALDEMATMTDATDTDEMWAEVFRGIDENRPHRPLFEGQY